MTILIADDHALFREGLRHVLSALAGEVSFVEAGSLPDALAALARPEPFDLIVADLFMPGMEGAASVAEICRLARGAPVAVLSGSLESDDVRASLDAGAIAYIPKSVKAPAIVSALQLVLVKSVFVRPAGLDLSARAAADRSKEQISARIRSLLTERQIDVLKLLAVGKPNKEIARQLNLAEGTVRVHVNAVLKALPARNRTEAAIAAFNSGLS